MYALRAALLSEIPSLIELSKDIWIPAFTPLFTLEEVTALHSGMYAPEVLESWMAQPGHHMYFIDAADGSERIGYLAVALEAERLKLDKIYVHHRLQGQGIGRWAMKKVIQMALEAQLPEVYLRVNRGNEKAIRFYQKLGFEIEAEVDFPAPNGYVYADYLMAVRVS